MARPLKESLDYFPLDIDFDQDDKLVVTLAKYGMEGLGIIVKLMGEVYRNGYFYPWTEREQYVFSNRVNVDINLVIEVVNECIKWGFFNKTVLEKHEVLTSKGFQRRYIEAAKRRKSITFIDDYLLIDPDEESKNVNHSITVVNADGNEVNVYINPDKCNGTSAETPQSKVKKSKVKKKESNKDIYTPEFESFWTEYPRKIEKQDAAKTFNKIVKAGEDHAVIIQCAKNYKAECKRLKTEQRYIKHAKTFLNEGRYKDYLEGGAGVGELQGRDEGVQSGGYQEESEFDFLDRQNRTGTH